MRRLITLALIASLAMAGCASLTPKQKKAAAIVGGILVVGAIAAHNLDHDRQAQPATPIGPPPGCSPQPNGSCR